MGCVFSKKDINDIHPNIFQVSNIDERGNRLHKGQLEVTDTDLVLYHRGKAPLKWPLRSLRRYGFDSQLFSFESGRRCPTGAGVYAFRCNRAEQLFNILQTHTQMRNSSTDDTISRDFAPPPPPLPPNRQMGADGNYLEPTPFRQTSNRFSLLNGPSRINSVGSNSNGPLSPQGTGSPSPPPIANNNYANEEVFNKAELEKHRTLCHSYSNTTSLSLTVPHENAPSLVVQNNTCTDQQPQPTVPLSPTGSVASDGNYSRLDESTTVVVPLDENQEVVPSSPVYMNVVPGFDNIVPNDPGAHLVVKPDFNPNEETKHCYENLEPGEIEVLTRLKTDRTIPHSLSLHSSSTVTSQMSQPLASPLLAAQNQVINYLVLDLEQSSSRNNDTVPPSPLSTTYNSSFAPDSPNKTTERYATIDFNRTVALSHSVNPNAEHDSEGSRKTRHNSTIPADFLAPSTTNTNRFSMTPMNE